MAKFYGQLRSIRNVLRASKITVLKLIKIIVLWVYYTIPFWLQLVLVILGASFSTF